MLCEQEQCLTDMHLIVICFWNVIVFTRLLHPHTAAVVVFCLLYDCIIPKGKGMVDPCWNGGCYSALPPLGQPPPPRPPIVDTPICSTIVSIGGGGDFWKVFL